MKLLVSGLILYFLPSAFAQDTLYLPVPGLGHEEFILQEDGTFGYDSHLCGFTFLSYGTFRKTLFGYTFRYDTTACPRPHIEELSLGERDDSITLRFHDLLDGTRMVYYGSFSIGGQDYRIFTDSIRIARTTLLSDSLVFRSPQALSFSFNPRSTHLLIYIPQNGFGLDCGAKDIRKVRRTRRGYLHKFHVYDEIPEKPWRKGKRRMVRHWYALRK